MADLDRFSLFTETRERLGQGLLRALNTGLPEIADALEDAAESAGSILGRRELFTASAVLRIEVTARAQRSLARLYDLAFRLLEINQSVPLDGEPPPLALVRDTELDAQILCDELARQIRDRLGPAYETALRRIDALTRTESEDPRAPLGAGVLAGAALEALRPMTGDRGQRAALRGAVLERLAPRLAEAMAETDAWLEAQGVSPWSPAPLPEPAPAPPPAPSPAPPPAPSPAPPPGAPPPPVQATASVPEAGRPSVIAPSTAPSSAPSSASAPVAAPATRPDPADVVAAETGTSGMPTEAPQSAEAPPAGEAPRPPTEVVPALPPADDSDAPPAPSGSGAPDGVAAPGTPAEESADAAMERAAESLVHSTQVADVLGRQPFSGNAPASGYRHSGTVPRPEALLQDAVAFAHHAGVAPYTRAARQHFFGALRERMLAAQAPPGQLASLDLVGALFDYVVDDARMPGAAQPLLWRLQHPAASLAALDAGYLGDDRRSVRRLVENLAAISVAYADDVVVGSELYRRLETVVRAVEVVSHAFVARSTVLSEQVVREYDRASQGVAQLVSRVAKERHALEATPGRRNRRDYNRRPSRERELEVTRRIEADLLSRIDRRTVPDSVRDFLLGVWLRHLRTALLRDGEDSTQYRLALQVVDDLLWSLDSSGPRQSRRQLASRIPPLIRLLTQGVSDIGARPEEFRSFLDELFLIHLRKMQKVPRDGDGADAAPSTQPGVQDPQGSDPRAKSGGAAPAGDDDPQAPRTPAAIDPTGSAADAPFPTLSDRLPAPPEHEVPPVRPTTADRDRTAEPGPSSGVVPGPSWSSPPGPISPALRAPSSDLPQPPAPNGHSGGWPWSRLEPPTTPATPGAAPAQGTGLGATDDPGAAGEPQAAPSAPTGPAPPTPPAVVRPMLQPRRPPESSAPGEGRSGDQRLLTVLSTLDIGDFPTDPKRLRLDPDEALARLRRGDWLELLGRDGLPQEVKVAWINARRTVVLLVRRPDRRALSLRAEELKLRFAQHKAALIV